MIEFLNWVDVLPIELFNLYVSVFACVVWVFTSFFERTSYESGSGLDRDLGGIGDCSVYRILRKPILIELDNDGAEQLVNAAVLEQSGTTICRESVST